MLPFDGAAGVFFVGRIFSVGGEVRAVVRRATESESMMTGRTEFIRELIRLFRLERHEARSLRAWLGSYYHLHWTENDSPTIEFKMRRSWMWSALACIM